VALGWNRQTISWNWAIGLSLPVLLLGLGNGLGLGPTLDARQNPQPATQQKIRSAADESARQVTAFAILATPGPATVDPRLGSIKAQLRKVLPGHGFKLLDVQSKRIEVRESVTCELGQGYKAQTMLVLPTDDAGKVHLRCALLREGKPEFSTLVKSPINQLFFYERSLHDGTKVLIGVGARDIMKLDLDGPR
jgi:hypothetical protein